jgi:DNA-binding CsgD family transcriptional regulator
LVSIKKINKKIEEEHVMKETYQNLKELAALYQGNGDLNEIAMEYKKTEDAILLSYAFCKLYPLIYSTCENYFGLTEEDKSSFALEELHKSMLDYRRDGGAQLQTLFNRYLNRRLRAETQMLNYDKRKSNLYAESFEGTIVEDEKGNKEDTGYSNELGYEEQGFDKVELLLTLADKAGLTENEFKYCEIIINEVSNVKHINDSEIASRLKISSAAVHYIKRSLQKKLAKLSNVNFLLDF